LHDFFSPFADSFDGGIYKLFHKSGEKSVVSKLKKLLPFSLFEFYNRLNIRILGGVMPRKKKDHLPEFEPPNLEMPDLSGLASDFENLPLEFDTSPIEFYQGSPFQIDDRLLAKSILDSLEALKELIRLLKKPERKP